MAIYVCGGMNSSVDFYDIAENTGKLRLVTCGMCEISGFFYTISGFIQELNKIRWYLSEDISDWIFDEDASKLVFYQKVDKKYLTYAKEIIKDLNPNTDSVYVHADIPIRYVSDPVWMTSTCKEVSDIPIMTDEQRKNFNDLKMEVINSMFNKDT